MNTSNMVIQCDSLTAFYDVIAGMVERGLTFYADQSELTITLTGGY